MAQPMAIYHLNVKTVSKAKGSSASAKFDYLNREEKYSKGKNELVYSESNFMPEFASNNPKLFWQSADLYERENGRLCQEIEFALPIELSTEQQIILVKKFSEHLTKSIEGENKNLPHSFVIHKGEFNHAGKPKKDGEKNPHCHLIISERINDGINRSSEQFFKRANKSNPEKGGATKSIKIRSKDWLFEVRKSWEIFANEALEQAGKNEKIDCRTLIEQGIEREPTKHRGVSGIMEARGVKTDRQSSQKINNQKLKIENNNFEKQEPKKSQEQLRQEVNENYKKIIREFEETFEKISQLRNEINQENKEIEEEKNQYQKLKIELHELKKLSDKNSEKFKNFFGFANHSQNKKHLQNKIENYNSSIAKAELKIEEKQRELKSLEKIAKMQEEELVRTGKFARDLAIKTSKNADTILRWRRWEEMLDKKKFYNPLKHELARIEAWERFLKDPTQEPNSNEKPQKSPENKNKGFER